MIASSLAQDADLNLRNNYDQRDEDKFYKLAPHPPGFVGMAAPYPLPPHGAVNPVRPSTETYSFHMPGLPVLLLPSWIIGSWFSLWWPATIVFMCGLGALLAVNIFLLAFEVTGSKWLAAATSFALSFSNPVMSYSYMVFTEIPAALFALYAFRRLALGWVNNGRWRLMTAGAAIAYLPWFSWRCVLILLPLFGFGLFQYWRARTDPGSTPELAEDRAFHVTWSSLAWFLAPFALSTAALVAYNLFLFGRPLPPPQVPESANPFQWPWLGADQLREFVTHGFGLLFDRRMGLLVYAPVYLLSVVGIIALARGRKRSDRALLTWLAIVVLPYVLLIMSYTLWNGVWNPPARFQAVVAPFLALPLAASLAALSGSIVYAVLAVLLTLPGVGFMAIFLHDPRLMWPSESIFGWLATSPASPTKINLNDSFPAFSPIDDLRLPGNTAWMTAVAAAIVALGHLLLLVHQGAAISERRLILRSVGSWVIALVLVAGAWYVVNAEYAKPRTFLVQQRSWVVPTGMEEPIGILHVDGVVFIAGWRQPTVGAFDIASGEYRTIEARLTSGQTAPYHRPGDVRLGADGYLYVLNNGPGDTGIYVMDRDGRVVRQIPLPNKSDHSAGFSIAGDGSFYATDMVGGRVLHYSPEGGEPQKAWGSGPGGFNNISGLYVSDDGRALVADLGNKRIHVFDVNGSFIRDYDLNCEPWLMARSGEWVDVTCGHGIVSVNLRSGDLRRSALGAGSDPLNKPVGIAHGADGLLYLLDGSRLRSYEVLR